MDEQGPEEACKEAMAPGQAGVESGAGRRRGGAWVSSRVRATGEVGLVWGR